MPLPKVIPALADLTQDIAGPLPVGLFQDWATGNQDLGQAEELLRPFQVEGTVVVTDTSGLSELTGQHDLLDVLALISAPKEVVHGLGVEIGGKPIGKWVADNTEMFYPQSVRARDVLGAMSEAQFRIDASMVRIGMCVHSGVFYEIGGGLYGQDANAVEQLAEQYAGPGEILVTHAVADPLSGAGEFAFEARADLAAVYSPGVFRLSAQNRMPELKGLDARYPHPFPDEFFLMLRVLKHPDRAEQVRQRISAAYLRERVVVFLARDRGASGADTLSTLLDDLVTNALMDTIVTGMAGAQDHLSALGGGIAILTFDTPREALDFAQVVRDRFVANGLPVKIGIDQGPVLFFANRRGPSGITGEPVNIASKISDDAGIVAKINLTQRVAAQFTDLPPNEPFRLTVSRISLSGVTL